MVCHSPSGVTGHSQIHLNSSPLKPYTTGIDNSGTMTYTGFPHFSNRITKLKQVGRQTQRDIQQYTIAVITGAASADVVIVLCALMEFQYFSQAPTITSIMHNKIKCALQEFHDHKHAIIEGGLCCGQQTNAVLKHWHIPKLKLMQSVAPSIKHDPASATNNHNYESQICWYLDHLEKCQCFDTAVLLHKFAHPVPQQTIKSGLHNNSDAESTQEDIADSLTAVLDEIWTAQQGRTNFFNVATQLAADPNPTLSFLTFIAGLTAIHLNSSPSLCCILINHVAQISDLPDLHRVLSDYLNCKGSLMQNFHSFGGQRKCLPDVHLSFKDLHVWFQVHLQQKSYHDPSSVSSAFSVHTHPPNNKWKYGHYDAAILNVDQEAEWPLSGLQGHAVIHVHLIMHPISPRGTVNPFANHFLMYAQQFNIVPQANGSVIEHTTGLHLLKRATHTSGSVLGEVFPLDQVRSYAHIVPHFDHTADNQLTTSNSIHFSQSFFLNKYFNKDFFYTIS
ncbi:hypothetical protein J3A83DRAFT_4372795 [Scleroderma citrinum]